MKICILSLLFSTYALAEPFKISGELSEFKNQDGLLLRGCDKDCLALTTVRNFQHIDLKKERAKESYVSSIGSDVCRLVYKANSIIGVNQAKDQRAFCVFKDDSLIEMNSLGQYLKDKKFVTE